MLGPTVFRILAPAYPSNLRETISLALTSDNQGRDGCEFFNPFLTRLNGDPALANSQELIDWMIPIVSVSDRTNDLEVFDAVVSGDLFEMRGGTSAFAAGYQHRESTQEGRSYPLIEPGLAAIESYGTALDGGNTTFFAGNDNNFGGFVTRSFKDDRDIDAVFLELSLPFIENVETQVAVRWEDYGGAIGDEVSPKIALSWRPIEELLVRGSFSESFRAPNTGLVNSGRATSSANFRDPLSDQRVRAGLIPANNQNAESEQFFQFGVPSLDLGNETADTFSAGFIWTPSGALEGTSVQMDFWRFEFEDRVVGQQGTEAIAPELALFASVVNDKSNYVTVQSLEDDAEIPFVSCNPDSLATEFGIDSVEREDCIVDPRQYIVAGIERSFDSGNLVSAEVKSVNAGEIITDGVDVRLGYRWDNDWGNFRVGVDYTHVRKYSISGISGFETGFLGTGVTDGAGTTGDGDTTLGSLPDNKGHITLGWSRGAHSVTAINRWIGSYRDLSFDSMQTDERNDLIRSLARKKIDDYDTWDLQYSYNHTWANSSLGTSVFTVGVLDVFEEDIPFRETASSSTFGTYDTDVFDTRGRRIYLRALLQF